MVPTGYRSFFFETRLKSFDFYAAQRPQAKGIPEVTGPQPLSLGGPLFWERPYPRAVTYTK